MKYVVTCALTLCCIIVSSTPLHAAGVKDPAQGMDRTIDKPSITGTVYDCIEQITKLSKLESKVDWEVLVRTGVKPDTKAFAKASKATVGQLLDLLLLQVSSRKYPLAWKEHDGVIIITTQARIMSTSRPARTISPVGKRSARANRSKKTSTVYDLQDMSLSDALDFIRTTTKLNIHVNWNSLSESGIDKESEISVQARGITVAHALDMILDSVNSDLDQFSRVYWIVDRGVVTIATGNALNTKTRTKIFNVSDLLHVVNDHRVSSTSSTGRRSDSGYRTSPDGFGTDDDYRRDDRRDDYRRDDRRDDYRRDDRRDDNRHDDSASKEALREGLISLIKDMIGEDMWQPTGPGSVKIFGDNLIVTQSLLGFKLMDQRMK